MVYINPPGVTMVSNPDFGVFSNNNYLRDVEQITTGTQQPMTETFQYNNQQARIPISAASSGLQLSVQSSNSPFFTNQTAVKHSQQQGSCLDNPSFNSATPSIFLPGNSISDMSYTQVPPSGVMPHPQGPPVGMIPHPTALPPQTLPVGVGVNPYPGGFTFNVPTQANPITGIPSQAYQSRGFSSCHAPGLGAAWQHAVPPQMPWGDAMKLPHGITTFTGDSLAPSGVVSLTQSMAPSGQTVDSQTGTIRDMRRSLMSVRESSPRPKMLTESMITSSPSVSSRKLKRHAPEDEVDYLLPGVDKKVFISERKMMQSMKELSLYPSSHQPPSLQCPLTSMTPTTSEGAERLQHFKEVEERLVLEDSDDEESKPKLPQGPKLEILDNRSFTQGILKPTSLLPQKLLEEITNRRSMEVVLWKPPGDFAKDLAPKFSEQNQEKLCWKSSESGDHSSNTRYQSGEPFSKHSEESVTMDTESFNDLDDDMQL